MDLAPFGLSSDKTRDDRLNFNHAVNAVEAVAAKTCKTRILPVSVTTAGDMDARERAKGFNRFGQGIFDECEVYDKDFQWCTDALYFGDGWAKVTNEDGEVRIDRVFPWEIIFDDLEARYGSPRTCYHQFFVDRMQLLEMYRGDKRAQKLIEDVKYDGEDGDYVKRMRVSSDMVQVTEAWHLPSGRKTKDGAFATTVKGGTLGIDKYNRKIFPVLPIYYRKPQCGIRGSSLFTRLMGPQRSHDKLTEKLDEAHDILGAAKILAHKNSKVKKSQIDDEISTLIEYEGDIPPTEWNAQPAHPDVYMFRDSIPREMLASAGIPDMLAQGKLPEGITAARALQMVDDVAGERLGPFWRSREDFYCKLMEASLDEARDCAKNGHYTVHARDRRSLQVVDLADVDIGKDSYKVQVFATSLLSKTPQAKYDQLSEMRARGDIDETEFRQLVDMPDLDAENDLETSTIDIIDRCISAILVDGKSFSAEPFDDHMLIVARGAKAYNLARCEAPDDTDKLAYRQHQVRLRNLATYIASAQSYMNPKPVQPQAGGAVDPLTGGSPAIDPMTGMPMPMDPAAAAMASAVPGVAPPPVVPGAGGISPFALPGVLPGGG